MNLSSELKHYCARPYGVHVYMAKDRNVFEKAQKALGQKKADDTFGCRAMCSFHDTAEGGRIILIGWFEGNMSSLVHECVHATFDILHRANVKFKHNNDESFAYLCGHMVGKLSK